MASTQTVVAAAAPNTLEDPLAHLPYSRIVEYKKSQLIYHQDQPSTSIYLVIGGRVKVARLADDGRQTIVDIYRTDDFFGESALLGLPRRPEQATALESARLMAWTAEQIDGIAQTRPRLAIALLQILVQRSLEYGHRIESFTLDNTGRRLARMLIRFSQRVGAPEPDGSRKIEPLTHELLAQYVGTSREIVTHYMNAFRRQGYLRYSRQGIVLYREAFDEWLCRTGTHAIKAADAPPPFLKRA
ncbi:MAG TPA: Crp/Fnr family transcriptional regulator [Bryobacteraceae bacterium]|nr:Crp/Fnr family transcriptional regulator [Bryobacteraceae bacterium]